VLGARRKPLQDAPAPAANPMAAMLLLRLHALNGARSMRPRRRRRWRRLPAWWNTSACTRATYTLALQRLLTPAVQVCVIGDDAAAGELERRR